jgi:hypothetical protein
MNFSKMGACSMCKRPSGVIMSVAAPILQQRRLLVRQLLCRHLPMHVFDHNPPDAAAFRRTRGHALLFELLGFEARPQDA